MYRVMLATISVGCVGAMYMCTVHTHTYILYCVYIHTYRMYLTMSRFNRSTSLATHWLADESASSGHGRVRQIRWL